MSNAGKAVEDEGGPLLRLGLDCCGDSAASLASASTCTDGVRVNGNQTQKDVQRESSSATWI
jgi:hypothetical protein